jgi:hypothetical protein
VEKRQSLEDLFLATHEDQAHVKKFHPGGESQEVITAIEVQEEDRRS